MNNQTQGGVPFALVADYFFNVNCIVAIDLSNYEAKAEPRSLMLYLIHAITHEFHQEEADTFYEWWLDFTGQRKVQPVHGIVMQ